MSAGFTKLFASITDSTIWCEDPETKVVWITMLAMANGRGQVLASIPGLAARARVSLEATKKALERFQAPDEYSRSQEAEGRRIETIDGGWHLINYAKYREAGRSVDRREYLARKQAERRARLSTTVNQSQPASTGANQSKPISEAEAEAEDQIPPGGTLSRADRLIAVFCEEWKGKYGDGFKVLPGDAGKAKRFIEGWPSLTPEKWRDMCRRYLAENGHHAQRRHPISDILANPNEFTGAKATGPPRNGFLSKSEQRGQVYQRAMERHDNARSNGAGKNQGGHATSGVLQLRDVGPQDGGIPRGPGRPG